MTVVFKIKELWIKHKIKYQLYKLLMRKKTGISLYLFSVGLKHKNLGVFEWLLMVGALALVLLFLPFSIWFCIKVRTTPQLNKQHQKMVQDLYI